MRALFGCDGATRDPWFIICPACGGGGCDDCTEGQMLFHRCPGHEMSGHEAEVISTWALVFKHRTWPAAGGLDDQAAWFVDAVTFLDKERAAYNEREIKRSQNRGRA